MRRTLSACGPSPRSSSTAPEWALRPAVSARGKCRLCIGRMPGASAYRRSRGTGHPYASPRRRCSRHDLRLSMAREGLAGSRFAIQPQRVAAVGQQIVRKRGGPPSSSRSPSQAVRRVQPADEQRPSGPHKVRRTSADCPRRPTVTNGYQRYKRIRGTSGSDSGVPSEVTSGMTTPTPERLGQHRVYEWGSDVNACTSG